MLPRFFTRISFYRPLESRHTRLHECRCVTLDVYEKRHVECTAVACVEVEFVNLLKDFLIIILFYKEDCTFQHFKCCWEDHRHKWKWDSLLQEIVRDLRIVLALGVGGFTYLLRKIKSTSLICEIFDFMLSEDLCVLEDIEDVLGLFRKISLRDSVCLYVKHFFRGDSIFMIKCRFELIIHLLDML